MSTKKLEIPEWTGSALTQGAFLNYALSVLKVMAGHGFNNLALTEIGPCTVHGVFQMSDLAILSARPNPTVFLRLAVCMG